jgi:hypothetical protein
VRFYRIKKRSWKIHIHGMLQRIPVGLMEHGDYMDSIDSQLSKYETAKEYALILELALWNFHMEGGPSISKNLRKLQCRNNSFSTGLIIIPNVLSFL